MADLNLDFPDLNQDPWGEQLLQNLADLQDAANSKADKAGTVTYLPAPGAGVDAFDLVQNAINALGGNGTVRLGPGVFDLTKSLGGGLRLPANAASLTVEGSGVGSTTIKLSRNVPRAFDFWYTADGMVFKNITLRGFTVDANNIDAAAIAAPATVQADVTLAPGWNDVNVGSNAGFLNGGILYLPPANAGTAKQMVMATRHKSGSSTTIQLRNDSGSSLTLLTGDTVRGAIRDHVIAGNRYYGGSHPAWNQSFDNILFEDITAINIPTDPTDTTLSTGGDTTRSGIDINPTRNSSNPPPSPQFLTNITARRVNVWGGAIGIQAIFPGRGYKGFLDNITIEDCKHSTMLLPTHNYTSLNFMIGGGGYGGRCAIRNCWGEYSGDVGVEIDGMLHSDVSDVVIDDAWGGAFYSTNYGTPAGSIEGPPASTLTASMSNVATSFTVAAVPTGVAPVGYVIIGNELMLYVQSGGTTFNAYRALNGTTAGTHDSGAAVTFFESQKQSLIYTRCHGRRTRVDTGWGFYQLASGSIYPQPRMFLRECSWERTTPDLTNIGEAVYMQGLNPHVDIDGMTVSVTGIKHTTLNSAKASAFVFQCTGTTYPGFQDFPTDYIRLRNIDVKVAGTLATGVGAPAYSIFAFSRGYWHLDWAGISVTELFMNAAAASTKVITLESDPLMTVRGEIRDVRVQSYNGDSAPVILAAPNTSFAVIQWLRLRNWDLTAVKYSANSTNSNYHPFDIDATNQGAISLADIRHPSSIATGYPATTKRRTPAASSYSVTFYDDYVGVTSTASPRTLTLPSIAASNAVITSGKELIVADESGGAGTNNITLAAAAGETIDGASTHAITSNWGKVHLISIPGGWKVL